MEKQCLEMIDLQDKINEIVEKLVILANEKKRLVIQGNVKELDSLIREEGIVILELEKWEGARFRAQHGLCTEQPVLNSQQLLKLVADNCPQLAAIMQASISKLEINLSCLRTLNQHNNQLLKQSLDHIAFLEAAMVGDQPGTYSEKGMQAESVRTRINLLDRKV